MANSDKHDSPDPAALAREYMDLWQKQLAGTAADENVAKIMAQTVELMNAGASAIAMGMTQATQSTACTTGGMKDTKDDTEHQSGSPSTGATSGAANDAFSKLTERLERLEERIAALESSAGKNG